MALGFNPSAYESQQVFDELLAPVSSRPDARELFQHLIAAIGRIVPYEAQLVLLTEDGSNAQCGQSMRFRRYLECLQQAMTDR